MASSPGSAAPKVGESRRPKTGGRTKGTPNKLTGELKGMILEALSEAGGVDYLTRQARKKNPAPFMALLGKVLPMTLAGDADNPLRFQRIENAIIDPKR